MAGRVPRTRRGDRMRMMGRKNGSDRLDAAMAQLIENQAVFVSAMEEMRRDFQEIRSMLLRHERILQELPEAIKQTIGFKNK